MDHFEADIRVDGTAVLRLVGEVDLAVVDQFVAGVRGCLADPDARAVQLDFREVTFIDSSGLGALVLIRREAAQRAKPLSLVNVSPATSRLLQITGLHDAFDVALEHP
jgi:anti-anti-sigma factor